MYEKYMKSVFFPKSEITSKRYCQDVNFVFRKDTVRNNAYCS